MTKTTAKYIIIGAGLSGLTSAYMLLKQGETDFLILESRERVGGRILTQNNIDFGATWFQNHHEHVTELLAELHIKKFHQYSDGKSVLVYSSMAPAHYFENDSTYPSAYRIEGGSSSLIQKLADINSNRIKTNTLVTAIEDSNDSLKIITNKENYTAKKVIITIPPRIANRILFTPELPKSVVAVMNNTHTWMSNAIKVGLTFDTPFWRTKNLSGTLIGQVGAVTELYDHNDVNSQAFALMGFVNEALRDVSAEERKSRVLDHLKKYLGDEILTYNSYQEKIGHKTRTHHVLKLNLFI